MHRYTDINIKDCLFSKKTQITIFPKRIKRETWFGSENYETRQNVIGSKFFLKFFLDICTCARDNLSL